MSVTAHRSTAPLDTAILNVAQTVNENTAEILDALRAAKQHDVANELRAALQRWQDAATAFMRGAA
jgi:hypothetical protein